MSDIGSWLEHHGLGKYSGVFAENELTVAVLPELTEDDLRELGLPMGPRKQLLKLIRELKLPDTHVASSPPPTLDAKVGAREAERRQLTVMFADLVGSTELSQHLDPEDLREVNRAYQDATKAAIEAHGGYVARYMGDGVLAYFGYPVANEDDAEQAVLAGLDIARRVPALSQQQELAVRVGIATGPVVVGDIIGEGASQEAAVVGETPNLAARLQSEAANNQIVLSAMTGQLVSGYFELVHLGARSLKGFAAPQSVWAAIRPIDPESRFEARHGPAEGRLVGRSSELGLLAQRWRSACDGEGQVVLLGGEPGIGKSRLTDEFRRLPEPESHITLRYQCAPHHENSAYYPFISQLRKAANISIDGSNEHDVENLERLLTLQSGDRAKVVSLLASMLSLPAEQYSPLNLTPQQQKSETVWALCAELKSLSERQPVLILFEDAHWIDPTSKEVLDALVDSIQSFPVMIVTTHRPQFQAWQGYGHVTQLLLNRLTRSDGAEIIAEVTRGKRLPPQITQDIIDKADGVPLFVEELAKTVIDGDLLTEEDTEFVISNPSAPMVMPSTLQGSLMATLDRLGTAKEVAQAASCIGREFSYLLLGRVTLTSPEVTDAALERLEAQQLLFRRGEPPRATYAFKHALIQDAAYSSLLRPKRAELHKRAATALQEASHETYESRAEIIAHHLTEAGENEEAIKSWTDAGRQASTRWAYTEAEAHFGKALGLLKTLPEGPGRDQTEFSLQTSLGPVLMATKGYASPQAGAAYQRARDLSKDLDDLDELFKVTLGLRFVRQISGETLVARGLGEECLAIAQQTDSPVHLTQAHTMLAHTQFLMGEFAEAQRNAEEARRVYEIGQHVAHTRLSGRDPGAFAANVSGWCSWYSGYPDEAINHANSAIALATELRHPQSLEMALTSSAQILVLRREIDAAIEQLGQAIAIARKHGFLLRIGLARFLLGWTRATRGHHVEGIATMLDALQEIRSTGTQSFTTQFLGLLAEAYCSAGQIAKGLSTVDDALAFADSHNEHFWDAELLRRRGELLFDDAPIEAEGSFVESLDVARAQGAFSWQLRASSSLARCWFRDGRRREGVELLEPIYHRFTEGFDTSDLQEAKHLLNRFR